MSDATNTSGDFFSSGAHQKINPSGKLPICDTCLNALGFNIRWDQSHPGVRRTESASFTLSAEDTGVVIDALIEHRAASEERKAVNVASSCDERADACARLIVLFGAAPAPVGGDDVEALHMIVAMNNFKRNGDTGSNTYDIAHEILAAGFRRSPAPQVDAASDDDLHEAYVYAYATGEGSHRLSSAAAKRAVYELGVEAGIAAALRSPVGDKP